MNDQQIKSLAEEWFRLEYQEWWRENEITSHVKTVGIDGYITGYNTYMAKCERGVVEFMRWNRSDNC